jgi:glycosyl transferase family 25
MSPNAKGAEMNKLPIYLINLDRSPDRLEFVSRRLATLGLSFTRIPAVDGAALPEEQRAAFAAARPRDGRGWSAGQIGCFLSHFDAWRRIATGDTRWALVLEDDLHLSDALPAVIIDLCALENTIDIVRFESTGQWLTLGAPVLKLAGRAVRPLRSSAWGAGAYIISRTAAARLIATNPKMHTPTDDFLFNRAGSAVADMLATYQLIPTVATQDKFSADAASVVGLGSQIETGRVNQRLRGLRAVVRWVTSSLRGKTPVEFA